MQAKVYHYTGSETNPLSLWRSLNLLSDAWWFGWSETEIRLPQPLSGDLPHADWERLSIFNGEAELRLLSRGSKTATILLTESIEPPGEWSLCEQYPKYVSTQHILLGAPPKPKDNEQSSVEAGTHILVDMAYPVKFVYGEDIKLVAGRIKMRIIAEVYHYCDRESRLRLVRYRNIKRHEFQER